MGGAERGGRAQHQLQGENSSPRPATNEITSITWAPATDDDIGRQLQDFLAGTVYAAGAGHLVPTGGDGQPPFPAVFCVFVTEDAATFGPAPQLRDAFALVDEYGGGAVGDMLTIATGWSILDGLDPLVKLKLTFEPPCSRGHAQIVLEAANYSTSWRHIAGGGLVAITSMDRINRANSRPDASFADALESALLVRMGASLAIQHLITNHHW